MPAQERITMKLRRIVLFSLAVFSLCSAGAEETKDVSTPSNMISSPPASKLTTTVSSAPKTTVKLDSSVPKSIPTSKADPVENISKPAFQINATSQTTKVNYTAKTGKADSSSSSVTAASSLASPTAGPRTNTTTGEQVKGNDTLLRAPDTPSAINKTEPEAKTDSSESADQVSDAPSYSSIILPVVIALIVITLSVFLLVALYRMCWKTTPERQENGTEQAALDKENVKLISVKAATPETGDHPSQGKNKSRQHEDTSAQQSNKCV